MQLNLRSTFFPALLLALPLAVATPSAAEEIRPLPTGNEKPSEAPRKPPAATDAAKPETKTAPAADAKAAAKPMEKAAGDAVKKADVSPAVVIKTSLGEIKVKLNREKAPVTVENFLKYVDQKFFDGTIFHRVISGFMIQGGGFTPDMTQKTPLAPIVLESQNGLSNKRGTIAMARTGDPNSATAQFFINVVDNERLDYKNMGDPNGYAVFGEVTDGLPVVDKIRAVPTTMKNGMQDVPVETVVIESIRRVE